MEDIDTIIGYIDTMSYQELISLEEKIQESKSRFIEVTSLPIVQGHLCRHLVAGNYNFLGTRTPIEYYDVFSGQYINSYSIVTKFPYFSDRLNEAGIEYNCFMTITELEEIWSQYRSQIR